jgi:hypothetical protein
MTFGGNPGIGAEAARKALVENDRLDANRHETSAGRAALDEEELRDLERTLYVRTSTSPKEGKALPRMTEPVTTRRSLLDRLFRRG